MAQQSVQQVREMRNISLEELAEGLLHRHHVQVSLKSLRRWEKRQLPFSAKLPNTDVTLQQVVALVHDLRGIKQVHRQLAEMGTPIDDDGDLRASLEAARTVGLGESYAETWPVNEEVSQTAEEATMVRDDELRTLWFDDGYSLADVIAYFESNEATIHARVLALGLTWPKRKAAKKVDADADGLTPAQRDNQTFRVASARMKERVTALLKAQGVDRDTLMRLYDTRPIKDVYEPLGMTSYQFYIALGLLNIPMRYHHVARDVKPASVPVRPSLPTTPEPPAPVRPVESVAPVDPVESPIARLRLEAHAIMTSNGVLMDERERIMARVPEIDNELAATQARLVKLNAAILAWEALEQ